MAKKLMGLMSVVGMCLVFGCEATPEPDNFILILHGADVVNDQVVEVASNESISFEAKVGGSLVGELTTWQVEEGQVRGVFQGSRYANTWVNTTGSPITYTITVIGHNSHELPAEFKVKVLPAPPVTVIVNPVLKCPENFSCGAGMHCADGVCVADTPSPTPTCPNDFQCGANQHCNGEGKCVDNPPATCPDDFQCETGTHCADGVCVADVPGPLMITSVTVTPSGPFVAHQSVVFTVKTTGSGVLYYRLPTVSRNADYPVDPSGTTLIPYTWPFKVWPNEPIPPSTVGTPAVARFWPDDRNYPPYKWEVPIVFK